MNNKLRTIVSFCALTFALGAAGCGGGKLFERRQTVYPILSTNAAGQVRTNWATNTSYVVSSGATNALNNARAIANQVPGPWGALATIGIALVGGALGTIAKIKSNKAALVPVLIAGIEAANHAATKQKVKELSETAGVGKRLATEVAKQTE